MAEPATELYLVTGATGQIGRRVVQQLQQQGQRVRAWVRLGSDYQPLAEAGAELYFGDITQREEMWAALANVNYVISTHYHPKNILYTHLKSNLNLIEVAHKLSIKCFTYLSAMGVDQYAHHAPLWEAKLVIERQLINSSLNYVIIRPPLINHYLLPWIKQLQTTGTLLLTGDGHLRHSWISLDDLARITIKLTQTAAFGRNLVTVGGFPPLSRWDVFHIYQKLTQSQPVIIPIPFEVMDGVRWGLQWLGQEADFGTVKTLLSHEFICDETAMNLLHQQLQIQPESLEQFLQRYLGLDTSPS